jgi:ABC-type nitrate/sulfonate/bicarbonate transport system ATPase subunit
MAMIEVEGLSFGYGGNPPLFADFSLGINNGEAWTVIGPSGCGKSTLLLLIAGLTRPLAGEIRINGEKIVRARPATGLVLQDHGLLPWATVRENASLGLAIRKFYGPDGKHSPAGQPLDVAGGEERVSYWLEWLGIAELQDMFPAQLSRGQRQRAAIARTLVLEPDLLLMDEPFSALDAPSRTELQKVMNSFHRESGLTSVIVTHDIEEAVQLGGKILVLGNGCNRIPVIIDNHYHGSNDFRDPAEQLMLYGQLRQLLSRSGNSGR